MQYVDGGRTRYLLNKVPEITLAFWVVKVLSTTVGETGADFLAVHVGFGSGVVTLLTLGCLSVALVGQFRANRLVPWVYWLSVVLISIVGTQITDILTDKLGVSLYVSTTSFALALAAAFALWWKSEGTLSIHSITTTRRESFYWLVILLTFALGTATGDLLTEAIGLGFNVGVVAFGLAIAAIYGACQLGLDRTLAFWLAYILTRPLGASLGDLLSQATAYGGLGFGTIYTSLGFLTVIVLIVAALSVAPRTARSSEP